MISGRFLSPDVAVRPPEFWLLPHVAPSTALGAARCWRQLSRSLEVSGTRSTGVAVSSRWLEVDPQDEQLMVLLWVSGDSKLMFASAGRMVSRTSAASCC